MSVAMTVRVTQDLRDHLSKLSELRQVTMNRLVIQALDRFVAQETRLVEEELERSLAMLRKYRTSDPTFDRAIDRVVMAELSTDEDPAEGQVEGSEDLQATAMVRRLLNA